LTNDDHTAASAALAATTQADEHAPGGAVRADQPAVRIRIDLSYDGTGFSGWAAQPGRRTVEGVLSETLGHVLRLPAAVRLTVAGRTDTGVHARGQVAQADVPEPAWTTYGAVLLRRLSRALPPDIRVRAVGPAPAGFDARFSALWRRYAYRICDDPARADPLRRHDTLWHQRPLDLGAMNQAAALLLGEHDFAAFCRKREGATTVRALRRLEWQRDADGVAVGCVVADAFCHNMVRALVGALLPVGEGSQPTSWPSLVLTTAVRDPRVRVVPPHGLSLEEVRYPDPAHLAARATETRRVRALPPRASAPYRPAGPRLTAPRVRALPPRVSAPYRPAGPCLTAPRVRALPPRACVPASDPGPARPASPPSWSARPHFLSVRLFQPHFLSLSAF
jgi:tRNA pseudouridine38-40 synthase